MPATAEKNTAAESDAAAPMHRDRKKSVLLLLHNRGTLNVNPRTSSLLLIAGESWRRLMTIETPDIGGGALPLVERVDSSISTAKIDNWIARILDQREEASRVRSVVGDYSAQVLDAIARDDLEIDNAAIRLYGCANKMTRTYTLERLRTSLHQLLAVLRFLRLPGT